MIRFLISLCVYFASALIGIIAADLIFSGFSVKIGFGYILVAIIFAVLQSILSPLFRKLAEKKAAAFMGGIGLVTTFIALVLTELISSAFEIDGVGTWLGATLVVWLFGAIAAFLLPVLVVKRIVKENRR